MIRDRLDGAVPRRDSPRERVHAGNRPRKSRWIAQSDPRSALLLLVLLAVAGDAHAVLIDFDDIRSGRFDSGGQVVLANQYADRGVVFNSPKLLDFSGFDTRFARSGANAIVHCYAIEFCETPFVIQFRRPAQSVRVRFGYAVPLAGGAMATMVAFDRQGNIIARDGEGLRPSRTPIPIERELEVSTPRAVIQRVEVRLQAVGNTPVQISAFALDDLEFSFRAAEGREDPPAPLPDLSLGGIRVGDGAGSDRDPVIEALARNQGNGEAVASTIRAAVDGRIVEVHVPPLAPRSAEWVALPFDPPPQPGERTISAAIDPAGQVREANEANNRIEETVSIPVEVPTVTPRTPLWQRVVIPTLVLGVLIAAATALSRGRRRQRRDERDRDPETPPVIEVRVRDGRPGAASIRGVEKLPLAFEIAVHVEPGVREDAVRPITRRGPPPAPDRTEATG